MSDVAKVAAAAIVAAVCTVVVRKQAPEIGLLLTACASTLILMSCSGALGSAVKLMDKLIDMGGLSPSVLKPVIKVTGMSVVVRLAADLCRDAGEGALAAAVETAGAVFALLTVLPLVSAVLELLSGLL